MAAAIQLIFEQLFDVESSTYTYLIDDGEAGVCALCDPAREQIEPRTRWGWGLRELPRPIPVAAGDRVMVRARIEIIDGNVVTWLP